MYTVRAYVSAQLSKSVHATGGKSLWKS